MSETRVVKVKNGKIWETTTLSQVKPGDKIRMWEPDGTIVRIDNKYVLTVLEEPFQAVIDGVNTWGVKIDENA